MDWWIWVVAGFALLTLELASPGVFYLFFFGCGALAVGLLTALGWPVPLWLQGVLFTFLWRCCMIQLRREWGRFSNFSFRTPQRRISAYPARPSG